LPQCPHFSGLALGQLALEDWKLFGATCFDFATFLARRFIVVGSIG
jgi:hypothetical protein